MLKTLKYGGQFHAYCYINVNVFIVLFNYITLAYSVDPVISYI